ncbi:hypothetical protein HHK36_001601 [Tetracentron sinense]|uniref:Potassium channel domain-containing protein n=1 Tax=Tetracentron sinense TaxID=13715 RepID=A0A834ZT47_TETSI|nr:hypothetical protein HHK36_001601 [Tetracentron sinense]
MDDELLLSKKIAVEESTQPNSKRQFSSSGFLDLGPSWRQSHGQLLTSEAAIPIISPSFTNPSSSFVNLIANLNKKKKITRRSHSAPSLITDIREASFSTLDQSPNLRTTPSIVQLAFVGVILYIVTGIVIFMVRSGSFKGHTTLRPVDALYFTVVTLCTIGYGDIVPDTTFTKIFTCGFILVGFGFIDILLNGLVTYVLDRQEAVLLGAVDENRFNAMFRTYMIDTEKGRMRIRMKVGLALAVVVGCIAIGTIMVHILEEMSWADSFYLSVTSVTTVGYGDYAFKTLKGRCFAIVWLLVSTLAVARAFLYLTELRIDKRNRNIAKWVLQKKMTLGDLVAADLDNDGSIRRFRMSRPLFLQIQFVVEAHDPYFVLKRDAVGHLGLSSLQNVTVVMRMFAYGVATDAMDDYVRIDESTSIKSLRRFVRTVVEVFGEEYLRSPNHNDVSRVLLAQGEARGFPEMLGSINCMHWKWKNYPTALKSYKSEYVIYKLKEMGKVAEKDILQICNQFDGLDTGNCGKLTLADLMETHH